MFQAGLISAAATVPCSFASVKGAAGMPSTFIAFWLNLSLTQNHLDSGTEPMYSPENGIFRITILAECQVKIRLLFEFFPQIYWTAIEVFALPV